MAWVLLLVACKCLGSYREANPGTYVLSYHGGGQPFTFLFAKKSQVLKEWRIDDVTRLQQFRLLQDLPWGSYLCMHCLKISLIRHMDVVFQYQNAWSVPVFVSKLSDLRIRIITPSSWELRVFFSGNWVTQWLNSDWNPKNSADVLECYPLVGTK